MEKMREKTEELREELEQEEVNVYSTCTTAAKRCLYDCLPFGNAMLSTAD